MIYIIKGNELLNKLIIQGVLGIYNSYFCKDIYIKINGLKYSVYRVVKGYRIGKDGTLGKWIIEINNGEMSKIENISEEELIKNIIIKDDFEGANIQKEIIFDTYKDANTYIELKYGRDFL